jgi:hypothetical protein
VGERNLPHTFIIAPNGTTEARSAIATLTPLDPDGLLPDGISLPGDKFFLIAIENLSPLELTPAAVVFCLDVECEPNVPLYTLKSLQSPGVTPPPGMPAAGAGYQKSGQQGLETTIVITIDNVPPEYNDKAVFRLVLSSLRGPSSSDITRIDPDASYGSSATGHQRVAMLTVRSEAIGVLTIAGKYSDCQSLPCRVNLSLRPWYVDYEASYATAGNRDNLQFVAGLSLRGGEPSDAFYARLGVNNVELPKISYSNMPPRGYTIVYLFEDSRFNIYFRHTRATVFFDAPREDLRNLLRLQPPSNGRSWTIVATTDSNLPSIPSP